MQDLVNISCTQDLVNARKILLKILQDLACMKCADSFLLDMLVTGPFLICSSTAMSDPQEIGMDTITSQEGSPSSTQQGNQASPTQLQHSNSGELSSVVLNMDDVLSISENPQEMMISEDTLSSGGTACRGS